MRVLPPPLVVEKIQQHPSTRSMHIIQQHPNMDKGTGMQTKNMPYHKQTAKQPFKYAKV